MERQKKYELIREFDIYDLEGNIDKVLTLLSDIKKENSEFLEITLTASTDFDPDEGYAVLSVSGIRLESDKEFENKIAGQAKKDLKQILKSKNQNIPW
jgi:hypothetical protein